MCDPTLEPARSSFTVPVPSSTNAGLPGCTLPGMRWTVTAERLATLVVTILLLAMAQRALEQGEFSAFAGSVVGYVAGYWLPVRRLPPTKGVAKDG